MKISPKCERCEEPIPPVNLIKDWPSRFRGRVTLLTHRLTWVHYKIGDNTDPNPLRITNSQMDLCDGCWGDLLQWCNEPNQERLKIAAQHRRYRERVIRTAEERRERQINNMMGETNE